MKQASFATRARAAIEKHVPEARTAAAHWGSRTNLAWVRWPRTGGGYSYLALRQHLTWVTGEAGLAAEALELDELPISVAESSGDVAGFRVRLAELLGEEDRWWPAGTSAAEAARQLEWIVLQMRVKADAFFVRHPVRAPGTGRGDRPRTRAANEG